MSCELGGTACCHSKLTTYNYIVDILSQQSHPSLMKLTAASEYGCLALLAIAEKHPEWCKRSAINARFEIPVSYLEQILHRLAGGGFICSRRGAEGGFRLARESSAIVIADVIRLMDGALAPVRSVSENFYLPSPVEASAGFHQLFRRVRDAVAEILEGTTLEDVVEEERKLGRRARKTTRGGQGASARATATRERARSPRQVRR